VAFKIVGVIGSSKADPEALSLAEEAGMGMGRNVMLVMTADVLIAVSGEFGTLSEIAHALNIGKKVIGLRTWKLENAREKPIPNLIEVDTAKRAVDLAIESISAAK